MKYNDYPIPSEKLINVLNKEYSKQNSVCSLSYGEQQASLTELYYNLELCEQYLLSLKRFGAKQADGAIETTNNNLKTLNGLGITPAIKAEINKPKAIKSCFFDYLKCEMEVIKILIYLIMLDNLNYSKKELKNIAFDRINIALMGLN